ncbi:MAG: beta-Ala-His dipeptidase [Erysipelotrichaceae bacterium]|nr:beta-Ala-His dipeptidase [Erysipelotrichaceae bacterium]
MEFDLSKRYCYWFDQITKIPHPSFHEEKISNWLVQWAKDHGLRWKQDDMYNVIMYKPASEGYEDAPVLGLQAHMDMVAEKNSDVQHDFLNDPLKTWVDDEGWLHATGTTLGADDGTGVSYMLSILEDDSLKHPALECIFTVQEEVGLIGALHLKKEDISAHRVISLDGGGEYITAISAAGGCNVIVTMGGGYEPNDDSTFCLKVDGLTGGHSGGQINKEKGNAIKLLYRVIREMNMKGISFRFVETNGGAKMNAIAREAWCIVTTAASKQQLEEASAKTVKDICTELEFSDPGFAFHIEQIDKAAEAMNAADSQKIIDFIYLVPNGFRHRSMAIENLTLTSLNFGILEMTEGKVKMTISIRSAIESGVSHLVETISVLGGYLGADVTTDSAYPGWNYKEKSFLREKMNEVVKDMYGREIVTIAGHGGCECGVFCAMYEDMDIIGVGPNSADVHTPQEKLNLESFDRAYKLLVRIIELCR